MPFGLSGANGFRHYNDQDLCYCRTDSCPHLIDYQYKSATRKNGLSHHRYSLYPLVIENPIYYNEYLGGERKNGSLEPPNFPRSKSPTCLCTSCLIDSELNDELPPHSTPERVPLDQKYLPWNKDVDSSSLQGTESTVSDDYPPSEVLRGHDFLNASYSSESYGQLDCGGGGGVGRMERTFSFSTPAIWNPPEPLNFPLPDLNPLCLSDEKIFFRKLSQGEESNLIPKRTSKSRFPPRLRDKANNIIPVIPLRPSLFTDVPPTILFFKTNEEVIPLPIEIRRLLIWRLSTITPVIIRQTVVRTGYRLTRKTTDWVAMWGKHMKSLEFQELKEYQKVNHFPGSHNLGRKDNLLHHVKRARALKGDAEFNFLPETYCLPKDLRQLRKAWEKNVGLPTQLWIVKPPASARGTGIHLINKWNQVPKKQSAIVQKYIINPYLINGSKFDLRIYVLVSSFNPLRIYIFDNGLVRFASEQYSHSSKNIKNRYMHLTNYSINKKNATYTANESENSCEGHKWTLKALWGYLARSNVAALPGIVGASIGLPDVHSGYGFAIGNMAAFDMDDPNSIVSPGGVGFDINCGVRLLRTNLMERDVSPIKEQLAQSLFDHIPVGVGSKGIIPMNARDLEEALEMGMDWSLREGYAWAEDKEHCEEYGRMLNADPSKVSMKAKKRGLPQLGTLGAGNHYAEIQVVEEIFDKNNASKMGIERKGQVCVMIHSGSRGFGHQVATDALVAMEKAMKRDKIEVNDRQLACARINSEEGQNYLKSMSAAGNFAWVNRSSMTFLTRQAFAKAFKMSPDDLDMHVIYDVSHNIAKMEEHIVDGKMKRLLVHRKGSTRAFPPHHPLIPVDYQVTGQPVLIGGTMGTCSYVLTGTEKGMIDTFGTTCHGAGRALSRAKSRRNLDYTDVLEKLAEQNISIRVASPKLVMEEAPESYKNVTDVVNTCHEAGISKKCIKLRPIAVIKG